MENSWCEMPRPPTIKFTSPGRTATSKPAESRWAILPVRSQLPVAWAGMGVAARPSTPAGCSMKDHRTLAYTL